MQEIDFHRALHRPGTIVDAGAHGGAFTLRAATLPRTRIVAFEPLPAAYRRLVAAIGEAGLDNVDAHPTALGAHEGEAILSVPRVGAALQEEWASIAKDYAGILAADPRVAAIEQLTVKLQRLDALGLRDVSAMKIDVEGAELELLRGAGDTLARCRPVLSIEIEERHRPGSTRAVPAMLADLFYEGFYELWGEWHPVAAFNPSVLQVASPSPAEFVVSDPYVFIFYFVPPERRPELARLGRLPET